MFYYLRNYATVQLGLPILDFTTVPSAKKFPTATALEQLPPAALEHVAEYFRALSEPMRLRILNLLCAGETSVGDVAQQVQSSVANVSRHLAQMARHGLVRRESRGPSVYYRVADPTVLALCELVCGSIARRYEQTMNERAAFVSPSSKRR
jgi:DNA-binding transcriptional ArsR family regulator